MSTAGILKSVTFCQPQGDTAARRQMRKETQFVVFLYSAAKSLIKKDQISEFLRRKNDQNAENSLTKKAQNRSCL